jgi:hypothetical protein
MNDVSEFAELAAIKDMPISTSTGIASIALSMAMKYHSFNIVQDGVLYQQYKIEGKNMEELSLNLVFETAMKIEIYLLGASDRIAALLVDALSVEVDGE